MGVDIIKEKPQLGPWTGDGVIEPDVPMVPRRWGRGLLMALGIFIATFFLSSYRMAQTIDINSDEATYAIESVSMHQVGLTKWNGSAFFVHPPIFYAIEGAYFKALGVGNSPLFKRLVNKPYTVGEPLLAPDAPLDSDNVFNAIITGRYLSILYGSLIAVLLFAFGSVLLNVRMGALAALLFMIDPYIVRRNHFNMLEPLTTLFCVLMVYAIYSAMNSSTYSGRNRRIWLAGLFFGLSILSKELAALYVPGLLVFWLTKRIHLREVVRILVTGGIMYLVFPAWAYLSGNWNIWWETKTWLFRRLSGVIVDTGLTRPGSSITHTISAIFLDYWPSFLLLGVGGILAGIFLLVYLRFGYRNLAAELLSSFVIGCYGFFVVVWKFGGVINEQFFYLLMPLTLLAISYAVFAWQSLRMSVATTAARKSLARQAWKKSGGGKLRFGKHGQNGNGGSEKGPLRSIKDVMMIDPSTTIMLSRIPKPEGARRVQRVVIVLLGLLVAYDAAAWILRYGFSTDDSYAQVENVLGHTLPVGAGVVGRDALDLYLMPKNAVYAFSFFENGGNPLVPVDIIDKKIPYAILNDQSVFERYGGANVPYYNWIRRNGTQIDTFNGRLWATYVYQIDYTRSTIDVSLGADSVSINKPATASSVETATSPTTRELSAQNAFDGKASTRWASLVGETEWIYVDLGTSQQVGRVELNWEEAFAKSYDVQLSDDAKTWRPFYHTDKGVGGFEVAYGSGKGRYVRLLMTKRATKYGYSLWEISVYP